MHRDGETSVEELLASIKKKIVRDAQEAMPARPLAEPADEDERADILDLAEEVRMEDAGGDPHRDEAGPDRGTDHDRVDDDDGDAGLVGEASRAAMRDNLLALSMLAQPGAAPQIVRSGETSLEGLVREMLRPLLAQWLDTNLPPMVEKLVKAEIGRIAGKRD